MLSAQTSESIKDQIIEIVHSADLGHGLRKSVMDALGSKTRVLPEGKPNLCSTLMIRSHQSAGGKDLTEVIPAVAAMELLLAAYDIVDDIEDDEVVLPDNRRDLGQSLETVCSLLMLCHTAIGRLSYVGMSPGRIVNLYSILDRLGVAALRGQTMDMAFETQPEVPIDAALEATSLKSASLVRCAAELGAASGTCDETRVGLHAQFGWHFGLILQLMNDVSAIWPGGPEKSDLRLKKKTLPIAFALNLTKNEEDGRHSNVVKRYYEGDSEVSEEDVKMALWRCGAVHYTWIVAGKAKATAETIVKSLETPNGSSSNLSELLN